MSTVPRSHEIQEAAQRVFRDALPLAWKVREQIPDIYIDYYVLVVEGGEPTGREFAVQLKGTEHLRSDATHVKYSLKTEHLAYFLDKALLPVFLVVVDISTKRAWRVFLQRYAVEQLADREWRSQKTVTIKLPMSSDLSDPTALDAEVDEAIEYVRQLHPPSLQASVAAERRRLEAYDDRISVDVSYVDGRPHYRIDAKEDFEFTMTFASDDPAELREKLRQLLELGRAVEFKPGMVAFSGSPLFEHMVAEASEALTVKMGKTYSGALDLATFDSDGKELARLDRMLGSVDRGTKAARFSGGYEGSPLKVVLEFPLVRPVPIAQVVFEMHFDTSEWVGTPLLHLPHFDRLIAFMRSVDKAAGIRLSCEVEGNTILAGLAEVDDAWGFRAGLLAFVELVGRARVVSRVLRLNPKLPPFSAIDAKAAVATDMLYALLTDGKYEVPGAGFTARAKLIYDRQLFTRLAERAVTDARVDSGIELRTFDLLGNEVRIGPTRTILTGAELVTEVTAEHLDDPAIRRDGLDVEWRGGSSSQLTLIRVELAGA